MDERMSWAPDSEIESSAMTQRRALMEPTRQAFFEPLDSSAFGVYEAAEKSAAALDSQAALASAMASSLYLQACYQTGSQRTKLVTQAARWRNNAILLLKRASSLRHQAFSWHDYTLPPLQPDVFSRPPPITTSFTQSQLSSTDGKMVAPGSSTHGSIPDPENVPGISLQRGIMTTVQNGASSSTMEDVGDYLPKAEHQTTLMKTNIASSGFCTLPTELILQIMSYLPPESIYTLRQTSVKFAVVFLCREFQKYRYRVHRKDWVDFNFTPLNSCQKIELLRTLAKDRFCEACLNAWVNGERQCKVEEILRERPRNHCNHIYAGILCIPRAKDTSGLIIPGEDVCINQIVGVGVCNHTLCTTSVSWEDIKHSLRARKEFTFWCNECDQCIKLPVGQNSDAYVPHLKVQVQDKPGVLLIFSWDVCMMRVYSSHTVAAIRNQLLRMINAFLLMWRPCKHVVVSDIRNLIRSGICECFTEAGHKRSRKNSGIGDGRRAVRKACKKRHTYKCEVCGASYTLRFEDGSVFFGYRKQQAVLTGCTLQWVRLLDDESYVIPRSEDTKHYLWCDSVGCQTNRKDRWKKECEYAMERPHPLGKLQGLGPDKRARRTDSRG